MRSVFDWLEGRDGIPDGRKLFDEGSGLCAAYFSLEGLDWAFGYYVEPGGGILLLTVFQFDETTIDGQLAAAREEMGRCVALQHRVEDL